MTLYSPFSEPAQPLPPPMVKQTHTSKAPANSNENEDFTATDFMAVAVEFEVRSALRSALSLYRDAAETVVDRWLKDERKRMSS